MAHEEKIRGSNGRSSSHAPAVETLPEAAAAPVAADQTPNLLGELARAMLSAADHERERIASVVGDSGTSHIERIRSRAAAEADALRRLAEEDVDRIKDWSTSEIARIRGEASRRTDARRASLEEYLAQHEAVVGKEIESVENAVAEYGETLKRFFADLTHSTDPSEIARRAGTLPPVPDLEAIGGAARSAALGLDTPEAPAPTGLVGVMEPDGTAIQQASADTTVADPTLAETPVAETATAEAASADAVAADAQPTEQPAAVDDVSATPAPAAMGAAPDNGTGPAEGGTPSVAATSSGDAVGAATTPAVETQGAAVRLLRSIAPWTAPNHDGDDAAS